MQIILHSDDINLLTHWQNVCNESCMLIDSLDELKDISSSIIIINYSTIQATYKKTIERLNNKNNKIIVLQRVPNITKAKELLSLGVMAYGNAFMKEHFLHSAIETVKENLVWLHPEFTSLLIDGLTNKFNEYDESILEKLSAREKEVAILLKNAYRYKEIAQDLNITPRTVKAHAQSVYKKLNVSDRLGLALILK